MHLPLFSHPLSLSLSLSQMAESTENRTGNRGEEDEDYMGDLSQFLPPEAADPPKKSASKMVPNNIPISGQSSKKKSKTLSWQEQRKLERQRRQIEEDEQTLAKLEAPIPQSNIGFKLLKQMGYTPGSAIGKDGLGQAEPVGLNIRRSRAGIGREDPHKEKRKREEIEAEKKRRKDEALIEEFGSRQKLQWRSRRVAINFKKAKAALDQLENKEVIPEKNEEDEDAEHDDKEEEEITEEDLQEILAKLRDEFLYCLFCGFQYESTEALLSNCPGINEDDH